MSVSAPKILRCPVRTPTPSAGKPASWSPAASSKSQSTKYSARQKINESSDAVAPARRERSQRQSQAGQSNCFAYSLARVELLIVRLNATYIAADQGIATIIERLSKSPLI